MVSRLQRRMALRRKLHILRSLTCSKSVKKSSIIMDAFLYINKLKLRLAAIRRELSILTAIKREYLSLSKQVQFPKKEVKVEKAGKGFLVRVICEKGGEKLVSILEVFEEMGLIVLHARVSCNFYFAMEAIVVADQEQDTPNVEDFVKNITQAVLKAIGRQGGEETDRSTEVSVLK